MAATLQLTAEAVAGSMDPAGNTSQIRVLLQITATGTTHNLTGDTTGTLTVGGETISLDGLSVHRGTTTTLHEGVYTIAHNIDGTKTVTVAARFDPNTSSAAPMQTAQQLTLPTIPRASTVTATDANIGSVSMVAVGRKNPDYSHEIAWQFGDLSGYLSADGSFSQTPVRFQTEALGITLPESFYLQIPDSPSGRCTLTCTTYQGDTQVGQPQSTAFTVTADPELCGPELEVSIVDCNPVTVALTGDEQTLVQYASHALCTLSAQSRQGSTLVSKTIQGVEVEESLVLPQFDGEGVAFAVTDSRGYTNYLELLRWTLPYIPLTATVTAQRAEPTGGRVIVSVRGNCYNGSFGTQDNAISVTCAAGQQQVALAVTLSGNTYEATGELTELSYLHSHTLTVTVTDRVGTLERTTVVGRGVPVFHWGGSDFQFQVPVGVPAPQSETDAVNLSYLRGYALPAAGGSMTGDIDFGANSVGLNWITADGTRFCLRPMFDQNVLQIGRIDPLGQGYATFNIDTQGYVHLYDKPLQLRSGGTGGTDAASARQGLGIGCVNLLTQPVASSQEVAVAAGAYKAYLVVGSPSSGGSLVSLMIPAAEITETALRWQLADDGSYTAFLLHRREGELFIARASGSGTITALYGIN